MPNCSERSLFVKAMQQSASVQARFESSLSLVALRLLLSHTVAKYGALLRHTTISGMRKREGECLRRQRHTCLQLHVLQGNLQSVCCDPSSCDESTRRIHCSFATIFCCICWWAAAGSLCLASHHLQPLVHSVSYEVQRNHASHSLTSWRWNNQLTPFLERAPLQWLNHCQQNHKLRDAARS